MNKDLGADEWGIHHVWLDAAEEPHEVPDETIAMLRRLVGNPPGDLDEQAPLVVRPGGRLDTGPVEVMLESGMTVDVDDVLPDDFPLGYHWCTTPSGLRRRLIVSPGRCPLPQQPTWGWAVQVYAARSRDSWGIGDLRDLRRIREWSQGLGAGLLMVSPLHAVTPNLPQEASPYLPATRRFRNPIYLCVEEVPGVEPTEAERRRASELNESEHIDRDAVWQLKDALLRRAFAGLGDEVSPGLEQYGVWCALALEHGPDWREWPARLQDPYGDAVATYAEKHADEVAYHCWLQLLLDQQLRAAAGKLTVIQDLPIGVSGSGFDAWTWQHLLASGATVGAPPDLFNTAGQDWGSPPPVPWRMREDGYDAFAQTIRATIAGAGGLRVDHVMGLFRLWWVPAESGPEDGGYVRYPSDDLLDIVALEAQRAGAIVVGEDLGTVEDRVRDALREHNMLSTRLLWFEDEDPSTWPEKAMAAVTTHDLPTVRGLWTGRDAEEQQEYAGLTERQVRTSEEPLLERLRRDGLARDASPEEAVLTAYAQLSRSPSLLLCAALEDAVGEERRPNLPATKDRPNWCLPLRVRVDDLPGHDGAQAVARLLSEAVTRVSAGVRRQ